MATALTAGKFYFIESDAGNQDWITNSAGDPDAIDLDNYTEGTDYIELNIPRGFTKTPFTGVLITPMGGGKTFDLRFAARFYRALTQGIQTSLANVKLVDKFIMSDRHTSGGDAFKRYYLIVYFGTNSHLEFTDASDNRKSYCKGIVLSAPAVWIESEPLTFIQKINWQSVW